MAFDLTIINGLVFDGEGGEPYAANIGVRDGVIAEIGRCEGTSGQVIDAAGAIVAGSYGAGLVWMAIRGTIFYNMFPAERKITERDGMSFLSYFDGAISAFWVMLVWSALYFGIKNYLQAQEERERSLKALPMAHEAQPKMLQYQLNPHFLFNTLNAISTLVLDKNNELANIMVTRLSRFLRYTLGHDLMQKVTVAEEITALQLYLDIEKVRFDERLELRVDVQPEASQALMPSLLKLRE